MMTEKQIQEGLKKIYKEMKSWPKINENIGYKISENEARRRELILIDQMELYKLEKAINLRDVKKQKFHLAIHNILEKNY
ncbi:MAG: hypothetical protein ABH873_02035 [Candidatus Firestonebacteria bacterium]